MNEVTTQSSFPITFRPIYKNALDLIRKLFKPFKWFVLLTYGLLAMSMSMAWLIFAPIPKQTASYFGITGKLKINSTKQKRSK